jgi:hypothetical protein
MTPDHFLRKGRPSTFLPERTGREKIRFGSLTSESVALGSDTLSGNELPVNRLYLQADRPSFASDQRVFYEIHFGFFGRNAPATRLPPDRAVQPALSLLVELRGITVPLHLIPTVLPRLAGERTRYGCGRA